LKKSLIIKSLLRSSSAISDLFYNQTASLKLGKIDFSVCTFAMIPAALFSSLFGTENGRRLPAGRQEKPKRPIINCAPIIFLLLLPAGKAVDNQIFQYANSQMHQNSTSIDLGSEFPPVFSAPEAHFDYSR
jgi:hypothetical protein